MAKREVVVFRNKATGKVWAVNAGTPAHNRMVKGVAIGEYEITKAEKPATKSRSRAKQPSTDEE